MGARASAYVALVELIRNGTFRGGQPMRPDELARITGFSRTPIREALHRLAAEGLIDLQHNRGARVLSLTAQDVNDLFDFRSLVESENAARLARRPDAGPVLDELSALNDRLTELIEQWSPVDAAINDVNNRFHQLLAEEGGSSLIAELLVRADREPLLGRTASHEFVPDVRRRLVDDHRTIVEAIAAGNPRLAAAAMVTHLEALRAVYLRRFS